MFEVPSNIKYFELQDLVNKKYGNILAQLSYIDEYDEQITIDSDLVLTKAIQLAIKVAYAAGEKEVVLRVLVNKLNCCKWCLLLMFVLEYFQCFECGHQYARDPRSELTTITGGNPNICTDCWTRTAGTGL